MITRPEASVVNEVAEQRSQYPVGLLSRQEKDRLIERGVTGLYRWYLDRSQKTRNWNPDRTFDWPSLRTDHSPLLNHILEGFYAVEQFVPDYTSRAIDLVRESYGRSHFHIRWGAEEEKHADLWLNSLLFSRSRSPEWIAEYAELLHRNQRWSLPWDDVIHLTCYTVVQERATQLNYLNTVIIATGKSEHPELVDDADPVLAHAARTIAVDEAAHYYFFTEVLRLYLYYYPADTLKALLDVINNFTMPALDLLKVLPDVADFEEATFRAGVYTPRQHISDVLQVALKNLGNISGRGSLSKGIKRSRLVPDPDGNMRDTALFNVFDYDAVEEAVKKIFGRIEKYEQETGLAKIYPTYFVPSGLAMSEEQPDSLD
ncbi:MAG: acyl-ACP desaturase [Anaerolineae bacterium]|nr:acyl-ACP desaturase [Anaerolineae bacterium]